MDLAARHAHHEDQIADLPGHRISNAGSMRVASSKNRSKPASDGVGATKMNVIKPLRSVDEGQARMSGIPCALVMEMDIGAELKASKLAPALYGAHNTLGTLYQKSRRFRDAETEYRRTRELNPRTADPLLNLEPVHR